MGVAAAFFCFSLMKVQHGFTEATRKTLIIAYIALIKKKKKKTGSITAGFIIMASTMFVQSDIDAQLQTSLGRGREWTFIHCPCLFLNSGKRNKHEHIYGHKYAW
jgi:hypothetical protein